MNFSSISNTDNFTFDIKKIQQQIRGISSRHADRFWNQFSLFLGDKVAKV